MPEPVAPVCVRLKRDLRVADHPALAEAAARARNRLWEKRMEAAQAPLPRSTGHGGRETIARLATCGILGCRSRLGSGASLPQAGSRFSTGIMRRRKETP